MLGTCSVTNLSLGPRWRHSSVTLVVTGPGHPLPRHIYPHTNMSHVLFLPLVSSECVRHAHGVRSCCSIIGFMSTSGGRTPTECTLLPAVSPDSGQSKRSSTKAVKSNPQTGRTGGNGQLGINIEYFIMSMLSFPLGINPLAPSSQPKTLIRARRCWLHQAGYSLR